MTTTTKTTTLAPKPEHKTYPDQNVLVGRIAHLPCHLAGHQFFDDKEPVQESEDDPPPEILLQQQQQQKQQSQTNIQSSQPLDMIQLILWYHGDDISGSPFYSVDARLQQQPSSSSSLMNNQNDSFNTNQQQQNPITNQWKHFLMDPYNERAKFVVNHHTIYSNQQQQEQTTKKIFDNFQQQQQQSGNILINPFMLIIDPVQEQDQGLYWCRVDYRWTRTTISKVKLNVYVPPKTLTIYYWSFTSIIHHQSSSPTLSSEFLNNKNNTEIDLFEQFKLELQQILYQQQTLLLNQSHNKNHHYQTLFNHHRWQSLSSFFPLKVIEIKSINVMIDSSAPNKQQQQQQSSYQQQRTQYIPIINVDEHLDAIFVCESLGGE
ncbi:hypothetical protein HUG17_3161 [Dermatophagoides farinae]|uniref:Immunoglobulin domain-containing protein n=1 Tax=Dermatophagoides farinae TaxID=6954 RepID=A0A9D4SEW1_DERFA|nr:hypothetical protein HUG17_3161 [Dermatophagoides farinae]